MDQPAARFGDLTAHGGVIAAGFPDVLIGDQPAARVADLHTCPMLTGPVPHAGGPILTGSTGVLVGDLPAARVNDLALCNGPPDIITLGCTTVLIGDG